MVYLFTALAVLCMMVALWLFSLRLKNASIVDIFWGAGFVLVAWVAFFATPDGLFDRKWLLVFLVSLWGLRLSIYIGRRNHGKPEDFRYQKWREEAGAPWWWQSFFKVFLLQGVLMWIIAQPLIAAQTPSSPPLGWVDYLGMAIWLVGFYFEAVGDSQLARFKAKPENQGKIMDQGLWRYTRHPNYFGDAVQWWGFFVVALAAGGWWTAFSPVIMTYLLVRVSGVALLDQSLAERKPDYREYIARTSAFIPWPPKKG